MPSNFLNNYLTGLNSIFSSLQAHEFEEFILDLSNAYKRESNVIIFGNGGSASTASHFACDINKGLSFGKNKRFKVLCLNDNIPTILAYANDLSYNDIFIEQLRNVMLKNDLVIGVSGSGNSKNVLNAIEYANKNGGKTFGICGFNGGKLKTVSHKSLSVASNDMQKVEDLHLIIFHCVMQYFYNQMNAGYK